MLLLAALSAPIAGQAVTLGEARVNSFLNQPLNAEIDLIGLAAGQHEDLRLRIANDRHFERLGIAYTRFLTALTFDVAQMDGRWIVRARSTQPVTEPFLDFPLQMTWPGGQLIKQYTLLLDPPRRIQTAKVTRTRQAKTPATPARSPVTDGASSYGPVKSGETLWPIAQRLKPRGITTRQMAMALLRANPQAFIDGNINKLRAGATLEIPQRSFIEQLDATAARAEFTAQTRQWQAPVATSPRVVEAPLTRISAPQPSAQAEAGKDIKDPSADEVAERQASNEAQLRILTESDVQEKPVGSQQNLQEQLLVTMEEIESNRITTDAIESRLARMEAELTRMQKLVELKDAQIAALQSDAAAREAIQAAAQVAEPPPPPPVKADMTQAKTSTPDTAREKAPVSITRIEPLPTDATSPAIRPWYEEYLWAIWVALGLMGLAALLLLMRRPQPAAEEAMLPGLPAVDSTRQPAPFEAVDTTAKAQTEEANDRLRQAEEDFRRLAEKQLSEPAAIEAKQELPELDVPVYKEADEDIQDGITESLLNEVLEDNKQLADHPTTTVVKESDFSDDDIASWVAELGAEAEQAETQSANDERFPVDDDIPSILTELDDQLSQEKPSAMRTPAPIQLEPVSDPVSDPGEDDTFSMSLDLARAYLEIGDQEGARDMLKQALSGARDPDHRRQIEELLQQID
jgi:FimV-like protein